MMLKLVIKVNVKYTIFFRKTSTIIFLTKINEIAKNKKY